MISVRELAKLSQDFQQALPLVAFPMNLRLNLHDMDQAREFITDLSKTAQGDEVNIANYDQLQHYMQAQNMLQTVITLPKFDSKKKIELWQRDRFKLPYSEPVYIYLFKEIRELLHNWQEQGRYLTIPYEFYNEAGVIKYQKELAKLPPEQQEAKVKALKALNLLKDPQLLFDRAKITAGNNLATLVELVKSKHADKNNLIDHVFLDLRHDLPDMNMLNAVFQISQWLSYGVDERYKITDNMLDKIVKGITEGGKHSQQAKNDEAKKKEEQEMKNSETDIERFKKQAKELRESEAGPTQDEESRKELAESMRQVFIGKDNVDDRVKIYHQYRDAIQGMRTEMSPLEYNQQQKIEDALYSGVDEELNKVSKVLVNMVKPA